MVLLFAFRKGAGSALFTQEHQLPTYKNIVVRDVGGNGFNHVYTANGPDMHIENCLVDGAQGHGVNTEPADVVQYYGLPPNIDRQALGRLLMDLAAAPSEEKRKSLLDPEGTLMRSLKVGDAAASLTNALLALSANPAIQTIAAGLLR